MRHFQLSQHPLSTRQSTGKGTGLPSLRRMGLHGVIFERLAGKSYALAALGYGSNHDLAIAAWLGVGVLVMKFARLMQRESNLYFFVELAHV